MATWTEVEPVEIKEENFDLLRKNIKRGTRGKNFDEELRHIPVCEMSNEHLINTIAYELEHRPNNIYLPLYKWEQDYRKKNNILIED